ncbi:WavE lipopolysaccharide synthesis family protein [Aeromonas jandaei]|uniref:WavE lipopolysaccharide synthesis family protein n=1 Tax=Aeromonas jandaei TaxID=650 RepID=UPI003986EC7E
MRINDSDITFVVQGPIQATGARSQIDGITQQCLNSIRAHFPESKIILSTWKGQPIDDLDFDQVLLLDDPGQNEIKNDDKLVKLNNNRQLYGVHMGLAMVDTSYAVKIRSDNIISGRGFLELYQKYAHIERDREFCYLDSRIITSSAFFISSHYGKPVFFHKSDLFDFGLTKDLLKIWPERQLEQLQFHLKAGYKERHPATEQYFLLHWLSILMGKKLKINNKANDDAGLGSDFWPCFVANNLIVATPEMLSLDVTDRFYKRGNLALELDLSDWLYFVGLKKQPIDVKRVYRKYKEISGLLVRKIRG